MLNLFLEHPTIGECSENQYVYMEKSKKKRNTMACIHLILVSTYPFAVFFQY